MTAQEQQMLQGLVDRINRTPLQEKDTDAEQYIGQTLGQNPDALYVMAQTVLVQDYALQQAQRQMADLRAQLEAARQAAPEPRHAGSFLGNLLGRHEEPLRAAPPPAPPVGPAQYASAGYGPGLAYPAGGYPLPGMQPQGGFLRSAMQTAAGVAAGALAFEGIESLMHGFGHAAGYGAEFGGTGMERERPEEIVNNYYGDASPHEHSGVLSSEPTRPDDANDRSADSSSVADGGDARLHDASYVTTGADSSSDPSTNADDLSGTAGSDYSAQPDDSMLADDVSDQDVSDQDLSDQDGGGFDPGGGDFDSGSDGGGF